MKPKPVISVTLLVLLLCGCVTPARHAALRDAPLPELVPRQKFLTNTRACVAYAVSPDGKRLAWIEYHQGFWTLFTRHINETSGTQVETGCWCIVPWFTWARDSRHLLFKTYVPGKCNCHLFLADSDAPLEPPVDLTPDARTMAQFIGHCSTNPASVLVAQNKRCLQCLDLYEVELETGRTLLLEPSNSNVLQWFSDPQEKVRGRIRIDEKDRLHLEICFRQETDWRDLLVWNTNEEVAFLGFTPDTKGLWLLSSRGRDRKALVRVALESGLEQVIYADPEVDLASVFIGPQSRVPKLAISFPDYPAIETLDQQIQTDVEHFKTQPHQGIEILSMDDREIVWTVHVFDEKGASFYLYRKDTGEMRKLGQNRLDPDDTWSAVTTPIRFKSRDGLPLHGYLTRPRGAGKTPGPMVLLVHGGPWYRDYWNFDNMVQFLANRGYIVLQINYRGSEGYGRQFREAAIGEFAGKMHADLIDGVDWAVKEGIADPAAIAIVGGSYGGYAALVGLTETPNVFACGIAINGLSDLKAFITSLPDNYPPILKPGIAAWHTYLANPQLPDAADNYQQRSPLYHAEKMIRPVLIIYGERDFRVNPEQSEKMIAELKKLQKDVHTLKFVNEGHGINRLSNSIQMYQAIEDFLARHLGGRSDGTKGDKL